MDETELRQLASEMGMKKSSSADRREVEYFILDNQAVNVAKEEAGKAAERKKTTRTRRTTRQKNEKPDSTSTEANEKVKDSETVVATEGEAEEKTVQKKRGRKPKVKTEEVPSTEVEVLADSKVASTESAQEETAAPKKRGRKPKVKVEETPALPFEEGPTSTADIVDNLVYLPVVSDEANEQKPNNAPESASEIKDEAKSKREGGPSLDSFFPKAGKKHERERDKNNSSNNNNNNNKNNQQRQNQGETHELNKRQKLYDGHIQLNEPGANSQIRQPKNKKKKGPQQLPGPASMFDLEGIVTAQGVLEIMPDGYGFLRSSDYNYLASPDDVYVSQPQIKQYGLKAGDVVEGGVRPPRPGEKYFPLSNVTKVNGLSPEQLRDRVAFEHLVPLFPDEKFNLTGGKSCNISTRVVDMFAPIGKGQRALIVAPPKTGKTILLKDIANAISENHPDTYIIMLLIDERPEEVTDMARSVNAEVIASTFDEPAEHHVKIAGIVLEKAKRLVECGHDVVIMLDSITRLARAYNTVSPASGKILSGGVDANALQRPKRFFGAARNIENGGSLTIIATALTETSSKMDEVIFEEFKGTGNMELQLDRKLSNKRIFPAVDIIASSTRRDDLLLPQEVVNRMWILRNYLGDMNSLEAMEFIKKRMEMTRNNEELLVTMNR